MMKINKRNFESGNTLIRNIINKLKKKENKRWFKKKKKMLKRENFIQRETKNEFFLKNINILLTSANNLNVCLQ